MNKNNAIISEAMVYVNKLLLPLEGLYYHQYNHSLEVMERCVYLGKEEKLNSEEIEILALAGLFHDTGFVIQYDDNEYIGAKIARNYLTSVLYSNEKSKLLKINFSYSSFL
ncbi:MAG: HD domain-containing protein [Candidatus Gracilibacteria bacterium]|nr:HD domain-containing protein [Candidatus Gracilibacteria bacterium]